MIHLMGQGVHIYIYIYIYIDCDLINNVKYYIITLTIESTFVNTFFDCLNAKFFNIPTILLWC